MSARFVTASAQSLRNSNPPVTAYPFSVGFWAYPTGSANSMAWALGDTALSSHYWALRWEVGTGLWQLIGRAGGTEAAANSAASEWSKWQYVVARCISATNRRISVLLPNGSASHAQNTASRTPTGIDTMTLGCNADFTFTAPYSGDIAEYWMTNTDIQPDAAQLQDATLRQLAYNGPFSVPRVAANLVDYRSLRASLGSNQDVQDGGLFDGPYGRQVWVNTNSAKLGPHPPLAPDYSSSRSVARPIAPV